MDWLKVHSKEKLIQEKNENEIKQRNLRYNYDNVSVDKKLIISSRTLIIQEKKSDSTCTN